MIKKENKTSIREEKNQLLLKMWKKTKNKNIARVALEDKVRQKKSMCVVCDSRKSTFLKPIRPI